MTRFPIQARGGNTRRRAALRARRPALDALERRDLLAAVSVSVNAGQVLRPVAAQVLGVNLVNWDSALGTSQTKQMVQAAGLNFFRFPGGSASDDLHFNAPPAWNGQPTAGSFAKFISSVNGVGMATLDYGSGSPQEAAAFLAYLNAPVGNTTVLGTGGEWNDATNSLVQVNWQTAGYWASLRASAPLATDDGLNFLRLNHTAPFGIHDWEVGNELYGFWETDHHGQGGDPGHPHDPATYVAFAKQFQTLAATIDPTVSVGLDVGAPGGYSNWTANVLQQSAAQGFTVGFLSDHNYVQEPGTESDANLLLHTVSDPNTPDPNNPLDWSVRAADYESLLTQYLGASGANVELLGTEFNSVSYNPGKQTTSLVNGLFVADSLGVLLGTPYDGADVWDLRNSYETGNNAASSLYGWRQGGDYGLIGSSGSAPATGTYVPYPTYFAEQLVSTMVQPGGRVVQATSGSANLSTYAVLEPNGHLDLLVINKSAAGALTGQFQLAGFQPSGQAQVWQYGEAQDTAQSQTTDGHSALASFAQTLTVSGSSVSDSFPAYSMTVLDLTPASGQATTTALASSSASPVYGQPVTFTATVTGQGGATPTGTVTFSDGATVLGTGSVGAGGTATFTTAALAPGAHSVTAHYAGDASDLASTSPAVGLTVAADRTTVAVATSANPVGPGQSVTFTATDSPVAPGTLSPSTGTVQFKVDGAALGAPVAVSNGRAVSAPATLAAGAHAITAVYTDGSGRYVTSTGRLAGSENVQASTSTALAASASSAAYGQPLTFTATVSNLSNSAVPTGAVRFLDGTRALGSAVLSGGVATFTTSALAAGVSHSITASYLGATLFAPSASAAVAPAVAPARTSTALSASTPGPITYGQSITLTATVTNADSSPVPTGAVAFYSGTTLLGRVLLSGGVATLTSAKLPGGTDTLTASYAGTTNFAASTSTGLGLVVNPAATTAGLSDSAAGPVAYGTSITFLATVTDPGTGAAVAGTVEFLDGSTLLARVLVNASGQASFTTSKLARGSHTVTAVFVASANFSGSTSSPVSQSVV
jgi:hypothetical protein